MKILKSKKFLSIILISILVVLTVGIIILVIYNNELDYVIVDSDEPQKNIQENVIATNLVVTNSDIKILNGNNKYQYLLYLEQGKSYVLSAALEPANTTNRRVKIISSNSNVTISRNILQANSVGNAVVTLKSSSNTDLVKNIKVLILPSSVMHATTYNKIKVLGSYKATTDFTSKFTIPENGTFYCAQSMSLSDSALVINQVDSTQKKGRLLVLDRNFKKIYQQNISNKLGHANGATYNYQTGEHYIGRALANNSSQKGIYSYTIGAGIVPTGSTFRSNLNTPRIGYDKNLHIMVSGAVGSHKIYDYDGTLLVDSRPILRDQNQDIAVYNGVIYRLSSSSKIDMYRITDNAYLGSYNVGPYELEDMEIFDSQHALLLFYRTGQSKDKIYMTTKIKLFN